MRRGSKPAKSKEAKPPVARRSPKDDASRVRDLEKRLAEGLEREKASCELLQEKTRALTASLEQQTATSEILRVISSSPTEIQPVFDVIADRARRLCDADQAMVVTFDGELVHLAALANFDAPGVEAMRRMYPRPTDHGFTGGRVVPTGAVVHLPSILDDPGYTDPQLAHASGFRSGLGVPMLRAGTVIGAVAVGRFTSGPFSERQIALLKTFADQAVIAMENVRLFNETKEALERQRATGEILGVISGSPTDVQPVLDVIAGSARRLCGAAYGQVQLYDGALIHLAALESTSAEGHEAIRAVYPLRVGDRSAGSRAIETRSVVEIPDLTDDSAYPFKSVWEASGLRSLLAVPMLRNGEPIGTIGVGRTEPGTFAQTQIDLLQTFADQAVIAIENVRLFTELEARNRDLTATAEILQAISRSPIDVQPVLETVVENAVRLCEAERAFLFRFDGELLRAAAAYNTSPELKAFFERNPISPGRHTAAGRVAMERRTVHIPDVQVDPEYAWSVSEVEPLRTLLGVPMLKGDELVGVIITQKREVAPFTEKQIALVETFADQAVIAIENVRLFKELRTSNRDLTQALDQQRATSEILGVISGSPTDIQPVFDTIVRSAARLCSADDAQLLLAEHDVLRLAATHGTIPGEVIRPIVRTRVAGRVVIERRAIHVHDLQAESDEFPDAKPADIRSMLSIPLLREGLALGVVQIRRREVRPFTDAQIALLQTFADQAVIAIQNVRLFKELQARNTEVTDALSRQTATSEILRVISGSPTDVQPVFDAIIKSAVILCNGVFGSLDRFDGDLIYPVATHNYTPEALDAVHRMFPARPSRSMGVGRAILNRDVVHIPDVELDPEYKVQNLAGTIGFRSGLFVPMLRDGDPIGIILVGRAEPGPFSDNQIALLKTFADQAVIAIENVRLFKELEAANRGLAAASQHKSEFLANMSHELRTPLNAIIGFSEVLSERMFGELNEKQDEYLKDIYASGNHLLSLINDILDLSKIEAGRMELELSDFHLPTALDSALTLVRERAARRGIALQMNVDSRLGQIRADERKVRQVVLNLLSNAIKFTPEGGRIEVAAVAKDGFVEVSVSDTGVGIAPEDQESVFEEFRQVGTADKKVEGTGLGLTLCRKFVALHGGKIWVKSELGKGSTFGFTIPVTHGE